MTPIPTVRGEYFDVRRHNNRRRHRVARSTGIKIRWRCSRTQWQSSAQLSCMACVLSALAWTRSRREHTAERPRVRTSCRPARRGARCWQNDPDMHATIKLAWRRRSMQIWRLRCADAFAETTHVRQLFEDPQADADVILKFLADADAVADAEWLTFMLHYIGLHASYTTE